MSSGRVAQPGRNALFPFQPRDRLSENLQGFPPERHDHAPTKERRWKWQRRCSLPLPLPPSLPSLPPAHMPPGFPEQQA
eukprot:165646-Chlamydomonas_euryale.AAC.10